MMGTDAWMLVEIDHGRGWKPLSNMKPGLIPRNYVLFSMLANIRNMSGTGTRTWRDHDIVETPDGTVIAIPGYWYDTDDGGHSPLVPIMDARGVPEDCTEEWGLFVAEWATRAHAFSWITPAEVMQGDWSQRVHHYGVLQEEEYRALRDEGIMPTQSGSGAGGGEGVIVVSAEEYDAGVRGDTYTFVRAEWDGLSAGESCSEFLDVAKTIAGMQKIVGSSKIRFMLLFES